MQNNLSSGFYRAVLLYSSLILFSLYLFSAPAHLAEQAKADNDELFEGTWTLETATIQKITDNGTLELAASRFKDDSFIALYETLIFKAKTLTIPHADTSCSQGEFSWTDNQIIIPFMAAPHVLNYIVKEGKINFTQYESNGCEDCTYLIQTVYIKESHENDE